MHEFSAADDGLDRRDVSFDGNFDDTLRGRLRRKREQCRIPVGRLCAVLGVSPSTYRKWEDGKVSVCRFHNIQTVKMFLSGELDGQMRAHAPRGGLLSSCSVEEQRMREHFHSLMYMLSLLQPQGDLGRRISDSFINYCEVCRTRLAEALMPRRPRR